ncbi:hypothetical protein Hanom_Chr12g01093041 [Helianthus anomalus]
MYDLFSLLKTRILKLYIYMEPIKSNHHPSQYPPLDHAKIKSQPFKLTILTAFTSVISSFMVSFFFSHVAGNFHPQFYVSVGNSQRFRAVYIAGAFFALILR